MQSSEYLKLILDFREQKSKELKRLISYSEAIALWLSESVLPQSETGRKQVFTRYIGQ